ncbi:RNA 3 -terminal phosphate cyclase [Babesia ovis]|uniref:RNA 3 -terminal phosphate cyclase n=1 Tax=Babesia ovis TaxID=5869 RepID=A0A9W5TBZ6_BABOV|nr:RNA 3 -terminal phosphate cyclase [Babesia ovis]
MAVTGTTVMTKDRLLKHLELDSLSYLRIAAVLGILSHTSVTIRDTRSLLLHESRMLELLAKVTQGGRIEIDKTQVRIDPGRIVGGTIRFQCPAVAPLSYYLEPLVYLSVFSAEPFNITLIRQGDDGVEEDLVNNFSLLESFCSSATVVLRKIGCTSVDFKFKEPFEVVFSNTPLVQIAPVDFSSWTRVKKIRGSVMVRCLQPSLGTNVITGCKSVLSQVCDNIYIDLVSPKSATKPYISVALIAEGQTVVYTADTTISLNGGTSSGGNSTPGLSSAVSGNTSLSKILEIAQRKSSHPGVPVSNTAIGIHENYETIGANVANRLLSEIYLKGIMDTTHQHLPLLFMAMSGDYQVSTLRMGRLDRYSTEFLRKIKQFLGVSFVFEQQDDFVLLKCVGNSFHNSGITTF